MKRFIIFYSALLSVGMWGCKEQDRIDQIDTNAPAPAPLQQARVANKYGAAVIHYDIPKDENLLYIKATYEINPGQELEVKASYYVDSLVVEGFGREDVYDIKLVTVGKNEKESEPLIVQVNPLKPPMQRTIERTTIIDTFGGVRMDFENEDEVNLIFVLMEDVTGNGNWEELQTFYTKAPSGKLYNRGMEAVETDLALFIRDRWGNCSDTLYQRVLPKFEEEIPKPFSRYDLASDSYEAANGNEGAWGLQGAWDGVWGEYTWGIFASQSDAPIPQTFTADLNVSAVLSRIILYQRPVFAYTGSEVKRFELYGSNEERPGDDLFGGDWTLLGSFSSWKPSGSGPVTEEDYEYATEQGENFEIEPSDEIENPWVPVRYIRFRTMETWGGNTTRGQVVLSEITLFGAIQE